MKSDSASFEFGTVAIISARNICMRRSWLDESRFCMGVPNSPLGSAVRMKDWFSYRPGISNIFGMIDGTNNDRCTLLEVIFSVLLRVVCLVHNDWKEWQWSLHYCTTRYGWRIYRPSSNPIDLVLIRCSWLLFAWTNWERWGIQALRSFLNRSSVRWRRLIADILTRPLFSLLFDQLITGQRCAEMHDQTLSRTSIDDSIFTVFQEELSENSQRLSSVSSTIKKINAQSFPTKMDHFDAQYASIHNFLSSSYHGRNTGRHDQCRFC